MTKPNVFADQRLFMEACGQTTDRANFQQITLYADLINEEYQEWQHAPMGSIDDIDACLDMIVVIAGYMASHGWPMERLWAEVIRSNMSKVDPDTGKVTRREDGKILKPEWFSPPDLGRVLMESDR